MSSIIFPQMYSISIDRITCDEKNRYVKGYEKIINYKSKLSTVISFEISCLNDNRLGNINYEHNGNIYSIN